MLNKTTSSWYEVIAPDGKHGYMASQYLTFARPETQSVQTNVGFRNDTAIAETLDTTELDKAAAKLQDQAPGMAECVRKLVEENARGAKRSGGISAGIQCAGIGA